MIERIRTPEGDCRDIDHGPTPGALGPRSRLHGSIAVPVRAAKPAMPRRRSFDANEWKRMKRATDPAWAERERARDRDRRRMA